jgi:hypothetical protein
MSCAKLFKEKDLWREGLEKREDRKKTDVLQNDLNDK